MDKKVKSITIRVDEETREKIVLQANAEHREVSDFIRHTIITYLEKIEDVKKMTGGGRKL
jgi:uncharacterized protein (DUF1778 family)